MGSWASDCVSSEQLVIEQVKILYASNPQHELLRYWILPPEDLVDGKPDPAKEAAVRLEFKNCFWQRPEPWQNVAGVIVTTVTFTNYYLALKDVNTGEVCYGPHLPYNWPRKFNNFLGIVEETEVPF